MTMQPIHSFSRACVAAFLLGTLILLQASSLAAAEEIWVVAGKDAPTTALTRTEVANLFLGLGKGSSQLKPFDQDNLQLRERFYLEVAGLSLASIRAHWAKQVFTGRGRPPAMLMLDDVEQLLRTNPIALTYIPAGQLPMGSKLLLALESGEQK